jgi:hypothetical protein
MKTKSIPKRTTPNHDELQLTGKIRDSYRAQLDMLEVLMWRKLLATMSPEMREMLDVHDMLLDAGAAFESGEALTYEAIRPTFERAELILTGFKA